jgi:glutamyl-tRNA reductase
VKNVKVAGRDKERTEMFCRRYGGTPIGIQSLKENIGNSDLIVVATRSSNFVVDKDTLASRNIGLHRKLVILDLSNPRNVAPEVAEFDGVAVHTLDDLKSIAKEGLESRKEIVKKAAPLVQSEVAKISAGFRREDAEPIISDVYQRAEAIRTAELGRVLTKLKLTTEQERVVEYMSQRIIKKVLDKPVTNLRRAAEKGDAKVLTAAGQLFAEE